MTIGSLIESNRARNNLLIGETSGMTNASNEIPMNNFTHRHTTKLYQFQFKRTLIRWILVFLFSCCPFSRLSWHVYLFQFDITIYIGWQNFLLFRIFSFRLYYFGVIQFLRAEKQPTNVLRQHRAIADSHWHNAPPNLGPKRGRIPETIPLFHSYMRVSI